MGIVYVLKTEAHRNYVKIGSTTRPVKKRMAELNRGMLKPYECIAAWEFDDHKGAEYALHAAFEDVRHKSRKEFFKVNPARVLPLLEQFGRRSVPLDEEPKVVAIKKTKHVETPHTEKKGGRNFPFEEVGIERGALLTFVKDRDVTCEVVGGRRVEYAGEVMSLSEAAKAAAVERGEKPYERSGPDFWCYGDPPKKLSKLRDSP